MYLNPNIRASIKKLFKVLIIEIDFEKRNYLKHLCPNVLLIDLPKKISKNLILTPLNLHKY